jgi:hypothetical protein
MHHGNIMDTSFLSQEQCQLSMVLGMVLLTTTAHHFPSCGRLPITVMKNHLPRNTSRCFPLVLTNFSTLLSQKADNTDQLTQESRQVSTNPLQLMLAGVDSCLDVLACAISNQSRLPARPPVVTSSMGYPF